MIRVIERLDVTKMKAIISIFALFLKKTLGEHLIQWTIVVHHLCHVKHNFVNIEEKDTINTFCCFKFS